MAIKDAFLSFFRNFGFVPPKPEIIKDDDNSVTSLPVKPENYIHVLTIPTESPNIPVSPSPLDSQYRKFRLTYYLIAEQEQSRQDDVIPVLAENGTTIAMVSPAFFSDMSLQGSGKLRDGRLLNVTGQYVNVGKADYSPVLAYHQKHLPGRNVGYSGIALGPNGPTRALSFSLVSPERLGKGYGMIRGHAHEPFRTLAVDMGLTSKSDPQFRSSGGVVPAMSKVHIKEFVGKTLPDGSVHDGWFTAIDNGGGIFGAHVDIFVGTRSLKSKISIPSEGHLWYDGVSKLPPDYSYGLVDQKVA